MSNSAILRYTFMFRLDPTGPFGLPDGDKVVIPASMELLGPMLDIRTAQPVGHGTLSSYRPAEKGATVDIAVQEFDVTLRDNFLKVQRAAASPDQAFRLVLPFVDVLTQQLTAQYSVRFSATVLSVVDETGEMHKYQPDRIALYSLQAVFYNTEEMSDRVSMAAKGAVIADSKARKALLYVENACLLNEFADTLPVFGTHQVFTRALAFLQMYKALTSIIGEPGTDRDYQRRYKRLGLDANFWDEKAKPLYLVRNDEDVAHYSYKLPEEGAFNVKFAQAVTVFREAFDAYMKTTAERGESGFDEVALPTST